MRGFISTLANEHVFVVASAHREADKAGGNAITQTVAATWFSIFSELLKPVTPELAGLALFRCLKGGAGARISAYMARNAFHATSPSALCASSAR